MCCCLVTKSCPTLWDPRDCSQSGSSVLGISQARILERVAISFSRGYMPTQESSPCLLHWQVNSLLLSHWIVYICYFIFKMGYGAYLAVQWLRLHLPVQGVVGLTPVQCSSVQSLSRVWLFVTPWTVAHQASLSITNSQSLLKLMSIESVMPSNHLIFSRPLLFPPSSFPSIRVFSDGSVLCIR